MLIIITQNSMHFQVYDFLDSSLRLMMATAFYHFTILFSAGDFHKLSNFKISFIRDYHLKRNVLVKMPVHVYVLD